MIGCIHISHLSLVLEYHILETKNHNIFVCARKRSMRQYQAINSNYLCRTMLYCF